MFFRFLVHVVLHFTFKLLTNSEAKSIRTARLGMAMSIILFTRSPKSYKYAQSAIAVSMWHQHASLKLFKALNTLGVSQGVEAARGHVDHLCVGHNRDLKALKQLIMVTFSHFPFYTSFSMVSCCSLPMYFAIVISLYYLVLYSL